MNIRFETMSDIHQRGIMDVLNYYIETGTAAFTTETLPEQYYSLLQKDSEGYPAYALVNTDTESVIGVCRLRAFKPFSSFAKTACVTIFILPEYIGKGIGSRCMDILETEAKEIKIERLIAEISSENSISRAFTSAHGFTYAGELHDVGERLGKKFGVVYMEKTL